MTGRVALVARPATLADLDALAELCLSARNESSATKSACPPEPERLRGYLKALFGEAGALLTVVARGERPVGFVLSRAIPAGLFCDQPRVQIEAIFVEPSARRQGAGHALLGRVALQAAEAKAPEVVCLPFVGTRSLPRFFARIGFAPVGNHRMIATETLARRVVREPAVVTEKAERRRGLEELIALRKRRRDTGEIPVTPAYPAEVDERSKQVRRAVASRRPLSSP